MSSACKHAGHVNPTRCSEEPVELQYDLFEVKPDDYPRWIGAAVNLEHARKRLQELAQDAAGVKYFVREFCSGR
jgi:hypothetical protein